MFSCVFRRAIPSIYRERALDWLYVDSPEAFRLTPILRNNRVYTYFSPPVGFVFLMVSSNPRSRPPTHPPALPNAITTRSPAAAPSVEPNLEQAGRGGEEGGCDPAPPQRRRAPRPSPQTRARRERWGRRGRQRGGEGGTAAPRNSGGEDDRDSGPAEGRWARGGETAVVEQQEQEREEASKVWWIHTHVLRIYTTRE